MRDGNLLPRKQRTAERIFVGDAAGAERRGEERSERTVKGSGRERERERDVFSLFGFECGIQIGEDDDQIFQSSQFCVHFPEIQVLDATACLQLHQLLIKLMEAPSVHSQPLCCSQLLLPPHRHHRPME